ncbi:HCF164 [Symbiodinium sp. CCMP2592]|nr:HCF164 [Symbiodinium sp. CCMP2592]
MARPRRQGAQGALVGSRALSLSLAFSLAFSLLSLGGGVGFLSGPRRAALTSLAVPLAAPGVAWAESLELKSPKSIKELAAGSKKLEDALRLGRPVVVDFSAAWCGDCKAMAPKLQKIREEAGKEVEFVTLDVSFAGPGQDMPATFPYDKDTDRWARKFKVDGLPHVALLDSSHRVQTALVGDVPYDIMQADVEALRKGKAVPFVMYDAFKNKPSNDILANCHKAVSDVRFGAFSRSRIAEVGDLSVDVHALIGQTLLSKGMARFPAQAGVIVRGQSLGLLPGQSLKVVRTEAKPQAKQEVTPDRCQAGQRTLGPWPLCSVQVEPPSLGLETFRPTFRPNGTDVELPASHTTALWLQSAAVSLPVGLVFFRSLLCGSTFVRLARCLLQNAPLLRNLRALPSKASCRCFQDMTSLDSALRFCLVEAKAWLLAASSADILLETAL